MVRSIVFFKYFYASLLLFTKAYKTGTYNTIKVIKDTHSATVYKKQTSL